MSGRLLIIGAGGHGRSVLDLALSLGAYGEVAFASNADGAEAVPGFELLDERALTPAEIRARFDAAAVAIGDNRARLAKVRRLSAEGVPLPALAHPRAHVSPLASLGEGTVVLAGAVVNAFASVGAACVVNTCAVVEHECSVGDGCHLSPGAVLAGGSSLGEGAWLCAGATVSDHVRVCGWAVVGAGACVIRDIDGPGTYVGVPAGKVG